MRPQTSPWHGGGTSLPFEHNHISGDLGHTHGYPGSQTQGYPPKENLAHNGSIKAGSEVESLYSIRPGKQPPLQPGKPDSSSAGSDVLKRTKPCDHSPLPHIASRPWFRARPDPPRQAGVVFIRGFEEVELLPSRNNRNSCICRASKSVPTFSVSRKLSRRHSLQTKGDF